MLNPVDVAVDRWGTPNTVALAIIGLFAVAELTPEGSVITTAYLLGGVTLFAVSDAFETATKPTELDHTEQQYLDGEIDLQEFERRVDFILDPSAREIRDVVSQVGGVGPAIAANVAEHFDSIDDVRLATKDELAEVHNVGESTAEAIYHQLGEFDAGPVAVDRRGEVDAAVRQERSA